MRFEIETSRLGLRRWQESDFSSFAAMNADPRVMEFFLAKLNEEESRLFFQRIQMGFAEKGFGLWAVQEKLSHQVIGLTGLSVPGFEAEFTPCVEIAWRLHPVFWGKGYASEAATAVLEFGFETLKLQEIVSFTTEINLRSAQVMTRIGMEFSGLFDHPRVPEGHPLRRHVLYRKRNPRGSVSS